MDNKVTMIDLPALQELANEVKTLPAKVVVVAKYFTAPETEEIFSAGFTDIGETRIEALISKAKQLAHLPITWHFIGAIQQNKIKYLRDYVTIFHRLSELSIAYELNRIYQTGVKCFVEVNVSGDTNRGLAPRDVEGFVKEVSHNCPNVEIIGLMALEAITNDCELITAQFNEVRELQRKVQALKLKNVPCTELSLGRSRTYHQAIACGATVVRIGQKILNNVPIGGNNV